VTSEVSFKGVNERAEHYVWQKRTNKERIRDPNVDSWYSMKYER